MPKRLPPDTYEKIMSCIHSSIEVDYLVDKIRQLLDDEGFEDFDFEVEQRNDHTNLPFALYTGDSLHITHSIDIYFKEKVTNGWRRKQGFIP